MGHLSTSERVDATKVLENGCTTSANNNNSNSNTNNNNNSNGKIQNGECSNSKNNNSLKNNNQQFNINNTSNNINNNHHSNNNNHNNSNINNKNNHNCNSDNMEDEEKKIDPENCINSTKSPNNLTKTEFPEAELVTMTTNGHIGNGYSMNGDINDPDGEKEENEFTSAHRNKTDLNMYTTEFKGDSFLGIRFNAPLKWDKIIQISAVHLFLIYGFMSYEYPGKHDIRTSIWAYITGGMAGLGVTGGAHRLWTHKSYKANVILRTILMLCFSLAGQNTMFDWVRDHRVHHKFSETDADPHNAKRGFFFAHVGWLMMHKHPEVIRRGRQIDMSDVLNDPVIQFHQKYFIPLKVLLCFVLPTLVPVYFWNEEWYYAIITQCIFRYVFSLNFTWSVNSAAHMWGYRPFDRRINPSENRIVSFLAMGEGWHNYHHVFPWDYKAAELGNYGLNLTTMWIDTFAKLGWAWDRKQPSKELIRKTVEKSGDGTHPVYGHHHHDHPEEVPMPEDDDIDENSNIIVQKKVE